MSTRKIIDPKQNGEKVWLKGHAQAIYMSDGSTVEDAINNIDIPSLDDYVTETELDDKGFLTEHQDISHLASKNDVYNSISNIDFYTIKDNPVLNTEDGKLLFVDESGNIGLQLENDKLYVSDVVAGDHILSNKADKGDIPSLEGYAKTEDIPSLDGLVKTEDLPNFDEFAKTEDIPEIPSLDDYATKEWVNNKNYATEEDLNNIDYSSINNVPVSEDETGELNITDESGNIGMKIASEAVYAKDFVAGEHKLSEKVDKTYVDNSIAEIKNNSSDANIQAVDTGDVIDDVNVDYATTAYVDSKVANIDLTNYATTTYVDGLIGDINSVLESIINGNEINEVVVNIVETYLAAPVPKENIYDVICVLSKPLDVKQTATLYYLDGENQPQTLSLVVESGQTEFVFEQVMINHIEPDMYSVVIGEIEEEDANGIKVTLRSNFKFKYVYS